MSIVGWIYLLRFLFLSAEANEATGKASTGEEAKSRDEEVFLTGTPM